MKVAQNVIRNATQKNLSSFHNIGIDFEKVIPIQKIMDLEERVCSMTLDKDMDVRKVSYRNFSYFVTNIRYVKADIDPRENLWYFFPKARYNMFEDFIRFYLDVPKVLQVGMSLEEICSAINIQEKYACSPTIFGMIDIEINNLEISEVFEYLDARVCGIANVLNAMETDTCIKTIGSNLYELLECDTNLYHVKSDNITEVYEVFGIEAARTVILEELQKSVNNKKYCEIIANYMCREGYVRSFNSASASEKDLSFLLSFERPKASIINHITSSKTKKPKSFYSNFYTGFDEVKENYNDFSLIEK